MPNANGFHLIGTVGRSEVDHFPIGLGVRQLEAPATGQLLCFLNYHQKYYESNIGSFRLGITRREGRLHGP